MNKDQMILGAALVVAVALVAKKSGVLDKLRLAGAPPVALPSLDTGRGFDAADPGRWMSIADLMDSATGAQYDDFPSFNQTIDAVIGNTDREIGYGPRRWTLLP